MHVANFEIHFRGVKRTQYSSENVRRFFRRRKCAFIKVASHPVEDRKLYGSAITTQMLDGDSFASEFTKTFPGSQISLDVFIDKFEGA